MRGECGRVNEGAWELVFTLEIFDLYSITPTLTTLLPWIWLNMLQIFMGMCHLISVVLDVEREKKARKQKKILLYHFVLAKGLKGPPRLRRFPANTDV